MVRQIGDLNIDPGGDTEVLTENAHLAFVKEKFARVSESILVRNDCGDLVGLAGTKCYGNSAKKG